MLGGTGTDGSQSHAVIGKGAELARSPAFLGPPLRRARRPRPHRALCWSPQGWEGRGCSRCSASLFRPRREGLVLPEPCAGVRHSLFLQPKCTIKELDWRSHLVAVPVYSLDLFQPIISKNKVFFRTLCAKALCSGDSLKISIKSQ